MNPFLRGECACHAHSLLFGSRPSSPIASTNGFARRRKTLSTAILPCTSVSALHVPFFFAKSVAYRNNSMRRFFRNIHGKNIFYASGADCIRAAYIGSLLREFVVRAFGARRHSIAASEMHFGVTVRTVVRSAAGSHSRLVNFSGHTVPPLNAVCVRRRNLCGVYGKRRSRFRKRLCLRNCRASVFVADRQRVSQAACSPEADLWHTPRAA